MIEFLKGKKTYIIAIAIGTVVTLAQLGYVSVDTANAIISFLVPAGLITLRAGISKI